MFWVTRSGPSANDSVSWDYLRSGWHDSMGRGSHLQHINGSVDWETVDAVSTTVINLQATSNLPGDGLGLLPWYYRQATNSSKEGTPPAAIPISAQGRRRLMQV